MTENLKDRGNAKSWFLFTARLDAGAHFVCTLAKRGTVANASYLYLRDDLADISEKKITEIDGIIYKSPQNILHDNA